uniref:glutathione transferase n=1 Tax=Gopherus evgoodei TaxID=1825980 RepID=A0A8C4VTW7_9SAUR
MGLELYLDLLSQPCSCIYVFAKDNIPFDFKPVELLKGGGLNIQEFSNINSLKKVHILRIELTGLLFPLLSGKHCDSSVPEPEAQHPTHWYPFDIQKRAQVDEYRPWQDTTVRANASKILWLKGAFNVFLGIYLVTIISQLALGELNNSLKKFAEQFLQDKPFIMGSKISLADLVAIRELMQPIGAGCNTFEGWAKLGTWGSQVEEAVGKELFQEAHEWILNAQDLRKIQIDPQMKEEMKPQLLKMLK